MSSIYSDVYDPAEDDREIAPRDKADALANLMARHGNYPPGMDPCTVAGLNGEAGDGCPFAGEPFCTCKPY